MSPSSCWQAWVWFKSQDPQGEQRRCRGDPDELVLVKSRVSCFVVRAGGIGSPTGRSTGDNLPRLPQWVGANWAKHAETRSRAAALSQSGAGGSAGKWSDSSLLGESIEAVWISSEYCPRRMGYLGWLLDLIGADTAANVADTPTPRRARRTERWFRPLVAAQRPAAFGIVAQRRLDSRPVTAARRSTMAVALRLRGYLDTEGVGRGGRRVVEPPDGVSGGRRGPSAGWSSKRGGQMLGCDIVDATAWPADRLQRAIKEAAPQLRWQQTFADNDWLFRIADDEHVLVAVALCSPPWLVR